MSMVALGWLAAVHGWSSIPLGCALVLAITGLVPGRWGDWLWPMLRLGGWAVVPMAILFLPIILFPSAFYPWVGAGDLPAFKAAWLTPLFFAFRAVLVFAVPLTLLLFSRARPAMALAAAAAIVLSLTNSLAGVDWAQSVKVDFHSSIFGLLALSGQMLAGLCLALLLTPKLTDSGSKWPGSLLLAALLLWAYLHAMQFIVIWSADLPEEVSWYLARMGPWLPLTIGLYVIQGAVPIFALLSPRVRNNGRWLRIIAALTLVMRPVESAWLILPALGVPTVAGILAFAGFALLVPIAACALMLCGRRWLYDEKGINSSDKTNAAPASGNTSRGR